MLPYHIFGFTSVVGVTSRVLPFVAGVQTGGYPDRLGKDQVFVRAFAVMNTLTIFTKVNGDVEVVTGELKKVVITEGTVKRKANSTMTTVANLEVWRAVCCN